MHRHRLQRIAPLASIALVAAGLLLAAAAGDDWPQWLGPQRDGVWREQGLLETFPAQGPKVLWRTPIGEGYAGPAVADGLVVITDHVRAKGATNPKDAGKARIEG